MIQAGQRDQGNPPATKSTKEPHVFPYVRALTVEGCLTATKSQPCA